jgi:hypothetical protein
LYKNQEGYCRRMIDIGAVHLDRLSSSGMPQDKSQVTSQTVLIPGAAGQHTDLLISSLTNIPQGISFVASSAFVISEHLNNAITRQCKLITSGYATYTYVEDFTLTLTTFA